MPRTRISSKGQVVLPKEVRDRHGWPAGTELEVESAGDVVVLRLRQAFPRTTLDEVIGCIPYAGPPVAIEAMGTAVEEAARAMWRKFERQGE